METKQILEEKTKTFNWQLTLKVVIIGIVALVLLIPKFMIIGLVNERAKNAQSAKQEVMKKWSLEQTIRGPMITIPYIEKIVDNKNNTISEEIHECHILPKKLNIEGEIFPKRLNRSIYESVVYTSSIKISGSFEIPQFEELKINPSDLMWDKAILSVAISDLRGITESVGLQWNENSYSFLPGMDNRLIGSKGISMPLPRDGGNEFPANFLINLNLKGSEALLFAPIGETTEVAIKSSWNDPGFTGAFLPTNRNITPQGFNANWKVLNYNRNYPQQWKDNKFKITDTDFGVRLVTVADHYQKSERTTKYGILVILFVFLSFFLNEIITKQRIHPFQYILVGFAILIFYLLLLSISEHFGFNVAYLISAVSIIGMVLAYSRTFLKSWINSFILTSILIFSFVFIFVLMQLETYALLVGSIGLLCILGLTMFFTRKINWYNE